ncbi:hypothetical protein LF1_12620 [Rubripirellula obstinata]|uniref:Uncharacterized protein n=1 Tax=Rubripirellula obstinata TaxID=406547 RepID=A0A5B1CG73_9BACT|nr:hypothetical protein [Rubripirellula obstinata]KAA1258739.1 hypothetical protein LF1_12620 [Rubripirellula obstinata]
MPKRGSKSWFRGYRIAILLSVLVHVAFVALLWFWWEPSVQPSASQQVAATEQPATEQSAAESPRKIEPPKTQAAESDIEVPSDQIRSSVESQISQVNQISDSKKRETLDKKLDQLQRVSKPETVDQVAAAVAESMGIDQSQYADKPTIAKGEFDHNTAQIKAVNRTQSDSGSWNYVATMVDADGRQLETPLTQSEGASVYETFEKMKQYPMAESLYQKIIMPMLQKMIESETDR